MDVIGQIILDVALEMPKELKRCKDTKFAESVNHN